MQKTPLAHFSTATATASKVSAVVVVFVVVIVVSVMLDGFSASRKNKKNLSCRVVQIFQT